MKTKKLLSRSKAAKVLDISIRTLIRLEKAGIGPNSYDLKKGRGSKPLKRYDLGELISWSKDDKADF
jgi:phage terminase Nu1 subunit (DNA packaging protein)